MENHNPEKKRSLFDRRSGQDRRNAYNIDYFLEGGVERRNGATIERRDTRKDRRKDWIKISRWSSLHAEGKKQTPPAKKSPPDIE